MTVNVGSAGDMPVTTAGYVLIQCVTIGGNATNAGH